MNTDQVVEMIDAITEGKTFRTNWEGANETDTLEMLSGPDGIKLGNLQMQFVFDMTNPRTAREIAGALVAWANRKQGHDVGAQFLGRLAVSIIADGSVEFPSVNDWAHIKAGRDTRANWYARNIKNMTQETKDRNLKDLQAMLSGTSGKAEDDDIRAAIQILESNGARRV